MKLLVLSRYDRLGASSRLRMPPAAACCYLHRTEQLLRAEPRNAIWLEKKHLSRLSWHGEPHLLARSARVAPLLRVKQ